MTTTTDYKTVFQLAQDKGYKPNFVSQEIADALNEIADSYTKESSAHKEIELLFLTLIQKWLRDEHKIAVLIGRFAAGFYNYSIVPDINKSGEDQVIKRSSFSKCWEEYETALLEGIHESLKLI